MVTPDQLNLTELVVCAREQNPNAHRGLPRDVLLRIAQGEDIDLPIPAVDLLRTSIMGFILEHWKQVKPLLSCPARTKDPRACFVCTDVQVIECNAMNPGIEETT